MPYFTDPWTSKSAHKHTHKANTPGKKKKWSKIAEGLRKKGMEEGRAIRIANAAIDSRYWFDGIFLADKFYRDYRDAGQGAEERKEAHESRRETIAESRYNALDPKKRNALFGKWKEKVYPQEYTAQEKWYRENHPDYERDKFKEKVETSTNEALAHEWSGKSYAERMSGGAESRREEVVQAKEEEKQQQLPMRKPGFKKDQGSLRIPRAERSEDPDEEMHLRIDVPGGGRRKRPLRPVGGHSDDKWPRLAKRRFQQAREDEDERLGLPEGTPRPALKHVHGDNVEPRPNLVPDPDERFNKAREDEKEGNKKPEGTPRRPLKTVKGDRRRKFTTRDPFGRVQSETVEEDDAQTVDASKRCPDCHGTGKRGDDDCPTCDGNGKVEVSDACPDYRAPYRHGFYDREFSTEQRKEAASEGEAMPGGGFPIRSKKDLSNARQALGRAGNRKATIAHIKKRAKALGVELPEGWPNDAASVPFVDELPLCVMVPMQALIGDSIDEDKWTFDGGPLRDTLPQPREGQVRLYDAVIFDDDAKLGYTADGYLKAMPRIARTGIQLYKGSECGMPEMDIVKVYRPADAVFHNDTIHSYTHLPVTLDHPSEPVTARNWKKYAVGETADEVLRDGNSVRVPLMLRDHAAIEAFKDGTNQLSVGYDCDLDWSGGVTEDGEQYDAAQQCIRANHLAVVTAARGGPTLKIGDGDNTANPEGGMAMTTSLNNSTSALALRTVLIDGMEVQMPDTAAQIVHRTISSLEARFKDAKNRIKELEEEKEEDEENSNNQDAAIRQRDAALKGKDGEIAKRDEALKAHETAQAALKQQIADLQAQLAPAAIAARATDRMRTVIKAREMLGDRVQIDDSKSVEDIRRMVVEARQGAAAKNWDDKQVEAVFQSMETRRTQPQDSRFTTMDDTVASFGRPGAGYMTLQDAKQKAYEDYSSDLENAWKGPQHTVQQH